MDRILKFGPLWIRILIQIPGLFDPFRKYVNFILEEKKYLTSPVLKLKENSGNRKKLFVRVSEWSMFGFIFTFVDYIWIRIHNMAEKFNLHFRVCQQRYYLIYYLINGIRGSVSRDFRPLYLSWFEPTKLCSTPRRFSFMIVVFTPKRISPHCPFKSNQTRDFNFDSVVFNLSQWCVAHHWDYLRGMLHTAEIISARRFFRNLEPLTLSYVARRGHNFEIEYLREIKTKFENTLACLSGAQMSLNHEKTGGRKSWDTLHLIICFCDIIQCFIFLPLTLFSEMKYSRPLMHFRLRMA